MTTAPCGSPSCPKCSADRKSTRLNSSHSQISYAVFCLKKKKQKTDRVRGERTKPGQSATCLDRRRHGTRHGGRRRGQAALAGEQQGGTQRASLREVDRL